MFCFKKRGLLFFPLLIAVGLAALGCEGVNVGLEGEGNADDEDWYLSTELSPRDSAAVRAILAANGLKDRAVGDFVSAENRAAVKLTIDTLHATRLVLTKALDSCVSGFQLIVKNGDVETLSIADTIHLAGFSLQINHTKLREIPNQISLIKSRIGFYLSNNQLVSISPEIIKCSVGGINVRYNALCSLPDSMKTWITKNDFFKNAGWESTQQCP
jgi:hypothetical protein